tara:strand:- start:592 stop:1689 length:1098 start_codon:yes stop_codon:yes gene_type:complete
MIEGVRIINKDVLTGLLDLEDASVQTCVTSPPYWGLRDYGTGEWKGGDPECSHVRDSKKSKHTITGHKNNPMVGDAIYKTLCPRCGATRKDLQLGLEETPEEYIDNMVKVFRGIKRVLKDDGTLWVNIGDTYCGTGHKGDSKDPKHPNGRNSQSVALNNKIDGIKAKDMVGIPWMLAFALRSDGWYLRQDIIWNKPNAMPEPVKDRCTKAHEYIFLLSKSRKYYFNHEALKEPTTTYDEKVRDRDKGKLNKTPGRDRITGLKRNNYVTRNKRSVWNINLKPYKEAHFAVFPPELPEFCILAGSKEGDIVLDPFWGSGTTGAVARKHSRKAIGIELNPEYVEISMKRFQQQHLNFGGDDEDARQAG